MELWEFNVSVYIKSTLSTAETPTNGSEQLSGKPPNSLDVLLNSQGTPKMTFKKTFCFHFPIDKGSC